MGMPTLRPSVCPCSGAGGGGGSTNPTPDWVNVLDFAAVADGATDNTAAYTAALASAPSGTLYFPKGHFAGSLLWPDTGDTRDRNWHLVGEGINSTFLMPATPNTKLFYKGNRASGVAQGVEIGGFTVKAHPAGSTDTAIDMAGVRFSYFHDIGYSSNAGGDFASMFHFSAGQLVCYGNHVARVVIDGGTVPNTGPATVVLFDTKDDTGTPAGPYPAGAANDHELDSFMVYSNSGIATAFDCQAGVGIRIHDCFLESNTGCTYVIPGSGCQIFNNHFESGVTTDTIKYQTGTYGAGNDTLVYGNEFSDLAALTFPVGVTGNEFQSNVNQSAAVFTNNGRNNTVWDGARLIAGLPSFANNAAAVGGGLLTGDRYFVTGSDPGVIAVVT